MTLLRKPRRCGALLLLAASLAAIVAGCGGGTSQVQPYHPNRVIVFGDEMSALVDDGNQNAWKYSINGVNPTTNLRDCTQAPNWAQGLANNYGFVFAECNPAGITNARAVMRARPNATVEDPINGLGQQVSEQVAAGLGTGDLVTVLIGTNDILELYAQVQSGFISQTDAMNEAARRGTVAAKQVTRMLAMNTRAIVSTIPDLSKSPFARLADQLVAGSSTLIYNLVYQFNAYVRAEINNGVYDGHYYALVLADDMTNAAVSSPSSYMSAPANVSDPLCVVPLGICTNTPSDLTTAPGASTTSYFWASLTFAGPVLHGRMASSAVSRATSNPF